MHEPPAQDPCRRRPCASAERRRSGLAQGNPSGADRRAALRAMLRLAFVGVAAAGDRVGAGGGRVDGAWEPIAPGLLRWPAPDPAPWEADPYNGGHLHAVFAARDESARGWWLVGTGPTPDFGRALARGLAAWPGEAGGSVVGAVNLIAQPEAVMGNAAFGAERCWSLQAVAEQMRARCPDCRRRLRERLGDAGRSLTEDAIRIPENRLRGARVRVGPFDGWSVPRGPAVDALVLRHRASGHWLLDAWLHPGEVPDLRDAAFGHLEAGWARLDAVIRKTASGTVQGGVLWGAQGGPADVDALMAHRLYLADLDAAVKRRVQAGEPEASAASALEQALPERHRAAILRQPQRHALNWQRVWRHREAELFVEQAPGYSTFQRSLR